MSNIEVKKRLSNFELLRIVSMLIIVMHHYVVNSGLIDVIRNNPLNLYSLVLLVLGWGGKTAINCYILITGYFMCNQNITRKKFFKLLSEVLFYNIVIYCIFVISGYEVFSIKSFIKNIWPISEVSNGFVSGFLIFYLLIPYLNILIKNMNKVQYMFLLSILLSVYTLLPSLLKIKVVMNYVTWFSIIYLIAAYIRVYPEKIYDKKKLWQILSLVTVLLSWVSVVVFVYIAVIAKKKDIIYAAYFWVNDSNRILALVTAISVFMYFKNLNIPYNKFLNNIAACTFGVLLIHANSDTMRQWLWKDMLNNVGMYGNKFEFIHLLVSVISIYCICTLIDSLRIRFLEKRFF